MTKVRLLSALVDHDTPVVHLLSGILAAEGYQTLCCFSGEEGRRIIHRQRPDLIILNIDTEQRHSGLRVLTVLRLDPTTEHVPIIIVCSADELFLPERAEYLRVHGCEILKKPFNLNALFAGVTNIIGPPLRDRARSLVS